MRSQEQKEWIDPLEETLEQRDARMEWWREARFGLFIHWGVYSVPAGTYKGEKIDGIGEWIKIGFYYSQAQAGDFDAYLKEIAYPQVVKPQPVGDLTYVNCSDKSMHGRIVSNWKQDKDTFTWDVTIPANTTTTVYVPSKDVSSVTESRQPIDMVKDIKFLRMEEGRAVFEAGSGNYEFKSIIN
ncbi:MAG: hypothetical protein GY790_22280 [Bacteroidetes bacterium]|nr:hypothetical protein [Bacteroidota bacterium]